jgi:undecaprenyl diphosphate synthase
MIDDSRFLELASTLKREKLPNHVAIIMDGDGRWAEQAGMPKVFGHRKGAERVREVIDAAIHLGVKVLTLFAFGERDWARPEHEVATIMALVGAYLSEERDALKAKNVQLRTMGQLDRLPAKALGIVRETEAMLSGNTGLVLNLALSYGGRTELVEAARMLARRVQKGELAPQDINNDLFTGCFAGWDLPDPDLLIRTGGEQRIASFMLWQLAYTEFYFTPLAWPEFDKLEFAVAMQDYLRRQRRFGQVLDAEQATC